MAVMTAPWRGGFLKTRHQIAVALRVSNGSAMAAAIGLMVVAEWWKKLFFPKIFPKLQIGLSWTDWPNPIPDFRIKMGIWDKLHAPREHEHEHEQIAPARAAGRTQHAPAMTAPRTTHASNRWRRSHPKSTTAPRTTDASNGRQRQQRRQRLLTAMATGTRAFCFFFVLFFFSVWHSFLLFGSVFFSVCHFFNFWFCFFF